MKLEGTISLFPLRELIELIIYSSVTGVLNLKSSKQFGQIFFRDGVAYHCTYGTLTGERALTALFEEQEATFAFVADATSEETTFWGHITSVMDYCEEQADRWRKVHVALPKLPVVPFLVSNPGVDNMTIDTAHFAMISGIDGKRTLDEIIELLQLDALDVYEAAVALQQDGLLELRSLVPPAPPVATQAVSNRANKVSGSTIDRILATLPSMVVSAPAQPVQPQSQPQSQHQSQRSATPAPAPTPAVDPILQLLRS